MKRALVLVVSGLAFLALAATPAYSFDTSPHFDITRDALGAEGFGATAIQVVQVNNWFVDLYENGCRSG